MIQNSVCAACVTLKRHFKGLNLVVGAFLRQCLELLSNLQVEEEETLLKELQQLKEEEDTLVKELEGVEEQRAAVAQDLTQTRMQSQQLDKEELQWVAQSVKCAETSFCKIMWHTAAGFALAALRYQKEYSEFKRQQLELDDELKSVDNQMRYCQIQLDRLKKTNVFNATFHIWYRFIYSFHLNIFWCHILLMDNRFSRHSGQFGTINNFRLGRLPSVPVEWNEINAAWGQTVLLLHALANKMGLQFQRLIW